MFIQIIAKNGRKLPETGRKLPKTGKKLPKTGKKLPKMSVFCGKMFLLHYCSLRGWEKSRIFADLILFDEKKMKNDFSKKTKNGHGRMKSKNEALTYMVILSAESELSSANLSTFVTLWVIHSSMPKIAIAEKFDFKIFDRLMPSITTSLK